MRLCLHGGVCVGVGWHLMPLHCPLGQGSGQGPGAPFSFFPDTQVLDNAAWGLSFWVHQVPEAHLSAPSLTHMVGYGGQSRAGTCRRWYGGGRFCKSLRFIVSHPEPTIHNFPSGSPTDLLPSSPPNHLVIQMRNLAPH